MIMARLGTDNLQMADLLGAVVLQNALAMSGYAMKKLKLSHFTAI